MDLGNAVIGMFWVVVALVIYAVLAITKHAVLSFMRLFTSKTVTGSTKTAGLPALVADKVANDIYIISGFANRLKSPIVSSRMPNTSTANRYDPKTLINDPIKPLLQAAYLQRP